MKNNEYKEQVCIKYKKIIEIIGVLSKGYILQKQLIEYMLILDIATTEYRCRQIISELEYAELIKKISFEDTKNKIILLRKYAIRFLKGKKGSQSVGAITTCTTNKRYYKSIFINHFIIRMLSVSKSFLNNSINNSIIKALDVNGFNFVCDNLDIYNRLTVYGINKALIDTHIEKIIKERQLRAEIMCNAKKRVKNNSKNFNIELTNKQKREHLMLNATLEILKRKECYFRIFKDKSNYTIANIYYLDYCNTQNVCKVIENIAIIISIMENTNVKYKINFNVFCWDLVAIENIKAKLSNIDYIQQQLNTLYGIRVPIIDMLTIKYINIDMYKNYLGNVKKLNV